MRPFSIRYTIPTIVIAETPTCSPFDTASSIKDKGAKPRFPNADPKKDTRSSCAYQQPAAIITNRTAGNRQISLPDFGLSHPLKARDRISQANRAGVDWLQNRHISGLREHRIDGRPIARVGRYAFFLSERDQLRLFLRVPAAR
jgi:hypothetical protein